MIVEPIFLEHWKTHMLIQTLNDPCAPIYLIRLWAHASQHGNDCEAMGTITQVENQLAGIVRYKVSPKQKASTLLNAMVDCGFVTYLEEGMTVTLQVLPMKEVFE